MRMIVNGAFMIVVLYVSNTSVKCCFLRMTLSGPVSLDHPSTRTFVLWPRPFIAFWFRLRLCAQQGSPADDQISRPARWFRPTFCERDWSLVPSPYPGLTSGRKQKFRLIEPPDRFRKRAVCFGNFQNG